MGGWRSCDPLDGWPASPDFIAACARALHIDVTALTGQPYMTELQQDRLAELIRPIRESLDLYDLGADPDLTPRSADELTSGADLLCQHVRAAKLTAAAKGLPRLITELTSAVHRAPTTELWRALASAYRSAHDVAVKLGFYDLSIIALDRMDWAAQRANSGAELGERSNRGTLRLGVLPRDSPLFPVRSPAHGVGLGRAHGRRGVDVTSGVCSTLNGPMAGGGTDCGRRVPLQRVRTRRRVAPALELCATT